MARPQDLYDTFGSVPSEAPAANAAPSMGVKASPDTFGASLAKASAETGRQISDISEQFMRTATEAKVNDDYANKYVPAAAELRQQYDMLRGQDKIAGYDVYVQRLQELNKQFTDSQPGFIGQKSMSGLINRHIAGEVSGARSALVASQKEYSDDAYYDLLKANNTLAAQNYNNPELVNSAIEQNDNHILIKHLDEGYDPNRKEHWEQVAQAQRAERANVATGMIERAMASKDILSAMQIRSAYAEYLPGYQRLALDKTMAVEALRQTSTAGVNALKRGNALPEVIGAPPARVQALVADTARNAGVDPNHALAVLRIESADGQNLGARGTLGQDKASRGKPLSEQALALCENFKTASTRASDVLGRPAEPWEAYVVYQQGVGGGAELLRAAAANPDARAVDVLTRFYDPETALSAVSNNGGNATSTASDFVDHLKQLYTSSLERASCDFSKTAEPGRAILEAHEMKGVAVQPAASPVQALLNFDKAAPELLKRIQAVPNNEVREALIKRYRADRQEHNDAAKAYTSALVAQAGQLAADPKFTSMDAVPSAMYAALASDHPATIAVLEAKAEKNRLKAMGMDTKDAKEYGAAFYSAFDRIHSSGADAINSIADVDKVFAETREAGGLTLAGRDRLVKEVQGKGTPEGAAELMLQKQMFAAAEATLVKKDPFSGVQDPKGEELLQRFMANVLPAIEKAKAEGKTYQQIYDPQSKDYVGASLALYKRSDAQILADQTMQLPQRKERGIVALVKSLFSEPDMSTAAGLAEAVRSGKMTRADGEKEAIRRGYIRPPSGPIVPVPE